MKKAQYLYHDKQDLNLRFYQGYDEAFIIRKAGSLLVIADHAEKFSEFAANNAGIIEMVDDKFVESLRAEIHFAEFHQFEAFFALMIAAFQTLPDWLYLTTYPTDEIRKKAKAFLANDIEEVTNGFASDTKQFVTHVIYDKFRSKHEGDWESNLKNIEWMLRRIASKYIKGAEYGAEYNAYKHGLRVMTGESFMEIRAEAEDANLLHRSQSKDSLRFLKCKTESKEDGVSIESVHEAFIHFNPVESMVHLNFMHKMLKNMKNVRLALLKGESSPEIFTCSNIDKVALTKLTFVDSWTVSV